MPDSHDLAADNISVGRNAYLVQWNAIGPPYRVQFRVVRGEHWPQVALQISLGDELLVQVVSTEPRLRSVAAWLADETA